MPVQQSRKFANLPQTAGSVRIADVLVIRPADYNHNGAVDAADYVVWRDALGQIGAGLTADGNNNGEIDAGDYNVWRANFGRTSRCGTCWLVTSECSVRSRDRLDRTMDVRPALALPSTSVAITLRVMILRLNPHAEREGYTQILHAEREDYTKKARSVLVGATDRAHAG